MKNFFRKVTMAADFPTLHWLDRAPLVIATAALWIAMIIALTALVFFAVRRSAHAEDNRTRVQVAESADQREAELREYTQIAKLNADIDEIRVAAAQLILRVCPDVALKANLSFAEELQACNREIDAAHEAASEGR